MCSTVVYPLHDSCILLIPFFHTECMAVRGHLQPSTINILYLKIIWEADP